ncbi:hypothetical protein [Ferruginibacter sp.]
MKNLLVIFLFLISITINAQELSTAFDGHKWEAPYNLPIPKDWTIERFLIPISFAKQIPYKGVEDIRFTPGWAKAKSDEYWTYAFLWWLDDNPETDAKIIAENLKAYYTGLFKINTDSTKIPAGKIIPVTTSFKEATTDKGDVKTYTGTIEMNDYMQLKPITLNCIAHLKFCEEDNKTILFYELSPQPFTHSIWLSLNQLWLDFKCKK